jgi:PDZ domain-containing protein
VTDTRGHPGVVSERSETTLGRRPTVLIIVMFVGIMLSAVMGVVHLPYAVLMPGPVTNTLGVGPDGKPLIAVAAKVFPTRGSLDFTTVRVRGGPNNPVNGWQWIRGHLDGTQTVLPEEDLFPKGKTSKEIDHENAAEMAGSQQEAIAVALRALGQSVPSVVLIGGLTKDSPAKGALLPGDTLVSIDGRPVATPTAVRSVIRAHQPGEGAVITVSRGGKELVRTVKTVKVDGRAVVGVLLRSGFDFPTKVSINAGNVGGPSAGMMFALGIYDKLTPGALTGGVNIAGTGTIDDAGKVGPIGGIQQKLFGARNDGVTWFLAPAANCSEVVGHVPEGMRVVKVATFNQSRDAVKAIAAKRAASLPTCK